VAGRRLGCLEAHHVLSVMYLVFVFLYHHLKFNALRSVVTNISFVSGILNGIRMLYWDFGKLSGSAVVNSKIIDYPQSMKNCRFSRMQYMLRFTDLCLTRYELEML
jgi:hypothetical protein